MTALLPTPAQVRTLRDAAPQLSVFAAQRHLARQNLARLLDTIPDGPIKDALETLLWLVDHER